MQNASGLPTTASISCRWAGDVVFPTWSTFDSPLGAREKMLDGHFAGGKIGGHADVDLAIQVRGIPFTKYRAYIYYWMTPEDSEKSPHTFQLSVNGSSPIAIGRPRYELNDFYRYQSFEKPGNYQVFEGLSGDLTILALPGNGSEQHTLFIAGLQIVSDSKGTEATAGK